MESDEGSGCGRLHTYSAARCHRKAPSSIESDSPRQAFLATFFFFITIIVSAIIHE